MATSDETQRAVGGNSRKLAGVAAGFVGSLGIAVAAVLVAGTPLGSSPMATAGTTNATPWVPRPIFLPAPVPRPRTSMNAQNGGSDAAATSEWVGRVSAPFAAVTNSIEDVGKQMNAGNDNGMRTSCLALDRASGRMEATLPTPNKNLTAETQAAVDEISAMSSACLADPPDTAAVAAHGTEANNHLAEVVKLAQGG